MRSGPVVKDSLMLTSTNCQYRNGRLGESALQCASLKAARAKPNVGCNRRSLCPVENRAAKPESISTPAHINRIFRSKLERSKTVETASRAGDPAADGQ